MSKAQTAVKFEDRMVSVNDLEIDSQVQRFRYNPRKVEHIVKNYNEAAFGLITVSRRNAVTLVIVDGWHRWEAKRRLSDSKGEVLCRVFDGLTLAEEAQMFLDLNPGNQPTALDRYRMRLLTDDPDTLAIDAAIHAYGWAVHPQQAMGHLQCVNALHRIQKLGNAGGEATVDLLKNTIMVVSRAWPGDKEAGAAIILEGTAAVLNEYREKLDPDRLIAQLRDYSGGPGLLASNAQQLSRVTRARVPMSVADLIVKQYNQNLRPGGPTILGSWRRAK